MSLTISPTAEIPQNIEKLFEYIAQLINGANPKVSAPNSAAAIDAIILSIPDKCVDLASAS